MIDLHVHSTASDGQYSPSEIIYLASQVGLSAVALTDHDTVAGIEEAEKAAKRIGIRFIPGIEISVKAPVKELHILGYGIDVNNVSLQAMCKQFQHFRKVREECIFNYLAERGILLNRDQVRQYAKNGIIARPHFARAMLESGYVKTIREAFDKYLATDDFDKLERPKPLSHEGISCILKAGGIPVLAHPIQIGLDLPSLEQLIQQLKREGLQGLECYYSTHSSKQTQDYLMLAKKYSLVVTGGSDFHGEKVKPEVKLGTGINGSLYVDHSELLHLLGVAE